MLAAALLAVAAEEGWGGTPGFPTLPHPDVEALFTRFHRPHCPTAPAR